MDSPGHKPRLAAAYNAASQHYDRPALAHREYFGGQAGECLTLRERTLRSAAIYAVAQR